jgi:hypothetical protein
MTTSWRPSNGTGGDIFRSMFCDKCEKDRYDSKPCRIFSLTMIHDVGDKHYPKEWVCDDDGWSNPRCTAYVLKGTVPRKPSAGGMVRDKRQIKLPL